MGFIDTFSDDLINVIRYLRTDFNMYMSILNFL